MELVQDVNRTETIQDINDKTCWVCFAVEEDDPTAAWVRPCRCTGSNQWVHRTCLLRWVDEKQGGDISTVVECPQCGTQYKILHQKLGLPGHILDCADSIIVKISPVLAGAIFTGAVYWTAVTYGAVTTMQLMGRKEGLLFLEDADIFIILVGLPVIPIVLILARLVRWEDYLLRLWRKYSPKLPFVNYLFPAVTVSNGRVPADTASIPDSRSASRIFCGALLLPSIATLVGALAFDRIQSKLQRTLLGGIAYLAVKGCLTLFYKQQQYVRQIHRRVLNNDEQHIPPR